jgi:hypothetical protein
VGQLSTSRSPVVSVSGGGALTSRARSASPGPRGEDATGPLALAPVALGPVPMGPLALDLERAPGARRFQFFKGGERPSPLHAGGAGEGVDGAGGGGTGGRRMGGGTGAGAGFGAGAGAAVASGVKVRKWWGCVTRLQGSSELPWPPPPPLPHPLQSPSPFVPSISLLPIISRSLPQLVSPSLSLVLLSVHSLCALLVLSAFQSHLEFGGFFLGLLSLVAECCLCSLFLVVSTAVMQEDGEGAGVGDGAAPSAKSPARALRALAVEVGAAHCMRVLLLKGWGIAWLCFLLKGGGCTVRCMAVPVTQRGSTKYRSPLLTVSMRPWLHPSGSEGLQFVGPEGLLTFKRMTCVPFLCPSLSFHFQILAAFSSGQLCSRRELDIAVRAALAEARRKESTVTEHDRNLYAWLSRDASLPRVGLANLSTSWCTISLVVPAAFFVTPPPLLMASPSRPMVCVVCVCMYV